MDGIKWPGWDVVRLIGRGSFGSVYEIKRDILGHTERSALKVISIPQNSSDLDELYNDGYDDESITRRFQGYLNDIIREYSLMSEIKGHSNVVYCDDVQYIQHDNGIGWDIFIKMELLTALPRSLGATITEEQAVKVGMDMCSALRLCRKKNIIHRDIKPQNIFVSDTGDYKLGDFGIAKTAERTTGGTKIGTYKYMAPEVYNNQPYGSSADLYSLGLVLYWMLNERRTPFLPLPPKVPTSTDEDTARARRLSGEPLPEPAHGSAQLRQIVLKACAYDPKDRFADADEMLRALQSISHPGQETVASTVIPQGHGDAAPTESDDTNSGTVGVLFEEKRKPAPVPIRKPTPPVAPANQRKKTRKGRKILFRVFAIVLVWAIAGFAIGFFNRNISRNPVAPVETPAPAAAPVVTLPPAPTATLTPAPTATLTPAPTATPLATLPPTPTLAVIQSTDAPDAATLDRPVRYVDFYALYPDYEPASEIAADPDENSSWWAYLSMAQAVDRYVINCNHSVPLFPEPTTESERLQLLPWNTRVDCFGWIDGWALCANEEYHGWINEYYLGTSMQRSKPGANPTAKPTQAPVVWSAWSGWSTTPVTASGTQQVETKQEHTTKTITTYSYSRWAYFNTEKGGTWHSYAEYKGESYKPGSGKWEYKTTSTPLAKLKVIDGRQEYVGVWFNQKVNTTEETVTTTYYRYRTRSN